MRADISHETNMQLIDAKYLKKFFFFCSVKGENVFLSKAL